VQPIDPEEKRRFDEVARALRIHNDSPYNQRTRYFRNAKRVLYFVIATAAVIFVRYQFEPLRQQQRRQTSGK
jgi:hypothetical protein